MRASLWDQVGLPLLIGLAIQIVATALCFLSVRLWNYFIKQLKPQTTGEESAYDQALSDGAAVAHANVVPDIETGNDYGLVEGGQSMVELVLELRIVNGSDAPKAQLTGDTGRGALVRPIEMDIPYSQQEEAAAE